MKKTTGEEFKFFKKISFYDAHLDLLIKNYQK